MKQWKRSGNFSMAPTVHLLVTFWLLIEIFVLLNIQNQLIFVIIFVIAVAYVLKTKLSEIRCFAIDFYSKHNLMKSNTTGQGGIEFNQPHQLTSATKFHPLCTNGQSTHFLPPSDLKQAQQSMVRIYRTSLNMLSFKHHRLIQVLRKLGWKVASPTMHFAHCC